VGVTPKVFLQRSVLTLASSLTLRYRYRFASRDRKNVENNRKNLEENNSSIAGY
jgi:hypothetical protein